MDEPYTQPEIGVERSLCKAIREAVCADGGCRYCTHRAGLFESIGRRAVCGLDPPRAFPGCLDGIGGFEFDEAAYQGRTP